jgi:hypothetical protein
MAPTSTRVGDPEGRRAARAGRSSARGRRDVLLLALLAIGVMAAYLALERGQIDVWDGQAMASVGQNLLQHGSLKECCRAFGAFPADPGPYAKFGIGYSLLLAPLWHFQLGSNPNGAVWLGLANPLLLTATAVVIAKTGLVLGWRRSSAVLAALAFAFLTMAPLYSTEFFAEPGVTFGTALLVLGFALWQQRADGGAFLIGVGAAVAILFRPDSIIMLGPIVPLIALFRSRDELREQWRSWIVPLGVPIGLALGWTLFYDTLRYGNPLQVGYSGYYDARGFSMPILRGATLILLSGGKSFFLFSPILIAALPGMIVLARRRPPLAVVVVVIFVVRVGFYARWWTPEGGNSWGPRFLLPLCAVLAIPLGEALEHLHVLRARARRCAIVGLLTLVAASIVVELASLLVSYRDIFVQIGDVKSLPASTRLAVYDARQHRYLWTFSGNQILWNLKRIGSRQVHMTLYWFQHGATAFGVGMLVLAAVVCATAIAVATVSDRIEQQRGGSREIPLASRPTAPPVRIDFAGDT